MQERFRIALRPGCGMFRPFGTMRRVCIQGSDGSCSLPANTRQWIVLQMFKLLPKRRIFFDLVIRLITNRKYMYAFFCIF